jgi:hypothetical protein
MKQQASALVNYTHGLVTADVTVKAYPEKLGSLFSSPQEPYFEATFWLGVPTLDYRFLLLTARYGLEVWPVLISPSGQDSVEVPDQPAFETALRALLSSERTTKIVNTLMAHA